MTPTVIVSWKSMGFVGMVGVGALLAIMPSRLAGESLEARPAEVATSMPSGGFSVDAGGGAGESSRQEGQGLLACILRAGARFVE